MCDLVPEMTEQRAVGFAHRFALAFSFGGVGLRHVEGDEAATVPSHDRRLALRTADRVRQKIECETVGIFRSGCKRQPQPQQRIKEPVLGELDLAPMREVLGICEIGDGAVMAAGRTENFGILGRHEPIADVVLGVAAKAIALPLRRERAPDAIDRFQCSDDFLLRQIAQPQATAFALRILEIERLTAILALEELHGPGHSDGRCRLAD